MAQLAGIKMAPHLPATPGIAWLYWVKKMLRDKHYRIAEVKGKKYRYLQIELGQKIFRARLTPEEYNKGVEEYRQLVYAQNQLPKNAMFGKGDEDGT